MVNPALDTLRQSLHTNRLVIPTTLRPGEADRVQETPDQEAAELLDQHNPFWPS
jgi:hypothetical protein